jgi:hypothetical protein
VQAFTSCLTSWTGARFCSTSGAISWVTREGGALGKAEASVWKGAGTVSGNSEASAWRGDGFTSGKVGVSVWPIGDWTLEGLEDSGWMGKFISGEVGVSVWAGGDWVPGEGEISIWAGGSALGGLACCETGTSTSWSTIVSSASTRLRVNASVDLWEKSDKGHTSGWGIGRFWCWRLLNLSVKSNLVIKREEILPQ